MRTLDGTTSKKEPRKANEKETLIVYADPSHDVPITMQSDACTSRQANAGRLFQLDISLLGQLSASCQALWLRLKETLAGMPPAHRLSRGDEQKNAAALQVENGQPRS